MTVSSSILSLDHFAAGYGNHPVIQHLSLNIKKGTIFGLIGLNGSGKTTTIKTILGLRRPLAGKIIKPEALQCCYLPEKFSPAGYMTGMEFIAFTIRLYRGHFCQKDIESLAEKLGLSLPALSRKIKTYSKGMRQKIGILGLFSTGCDVIVLDEPMSGLDPKARHEVKSLMIKAKEDGKTIIFSSHILADVEELCDDVAILHKKKCVFHGTPTNMLQAGLSDNPEKAFLKIIQNVE